MTLLLLIVSALAALHSLRSVVEWLSCRSCLRFARHVHDTSGAPALTPAADVIRASRSARHPDPAPEAGPAPATTALLDPPVSADRV